jgi:tetratricopeptide (TPR) repeat protein
LLIQPYGCITQTGSLKLTEDERRSVFEKRSELADFLRVQTRRQISLFLGCMQGDPDFREFFHFLRPNVNESMARSHIIQMDVNGDDVKYWSNQNTAVVPTESLVFLETLSSALEMALSARAAGETPAIDEEERARRQKIILDFSQRLGLGSPVESGAQLQPITSGLATLRLALSDYRQTDKALQKDQPVSQSFDARLSLQEGNVEWAEGNLERAQEAFEAAIRRDPNLMDAYVSLHHLLVETGDLDAAADMYRQIVKHDPSRAFIPPQYQLLRILRRTNVGVSYHCQDVTRKQEVVVTILRRSLSHQTEVLKDFEQEVQALHSPQISQFIELGSFHARSYVVTEYIGAESLRTFMDRVPVEERPLAKVFELTNQIMDALMAGEQQGVAHRSLRPENILLAGPGVVLANYGFSRLAHWLRLASRAMDRPQSDYEAPEQKADALGDPRSDVYALATVLYELLTGRTPGVGEFLTVSAVHPQAGEALDVLIDHARSYDPDKRFQTVAEMRLELHRISLSMDYRRFSQYTRILLAGLSKIYGLLLSRRGGLPTLAVVFLLLFLGISNPGFDGGTLYYVRILGLLLVNSLALSAVCYYVIRELARERGLGSLIYSGRGIGASLGILLAAYTIRATNWGVLLDPSAMLGVDFAGYLLNLLTQSFLMLGAVLVVMNLSGWAAEKRWRHYTLGFYAGFFVSVAVIVLLFGIGPPPYVIEA